MSFGCDMRFIKKNPCKSVKSVSSVVYSLETHAALTTDEYASLISKIARASADGNLEIFRLYARLHWAPGPIGHAGPQAA